MRVSVYIAFVFLGKSLTLFAQPDCGDIFIDISNWGLTKKSSASVKIVAYQQATQKPNQWQKQKYALVYIDSLTMQLHHRGGSYKYILVNGKNNYTLLFPNLYCNKNYLVKTDVRQALLVFKNNSKDNNTYLSFDKCPAPCIELKPESKKMNFKNQN